MDRGGRMREAMLVSTGVSWLDQALGQLRIGENVVWEVEAGTRVEAFVRAFLDSNIKTGSNAVYVSFNHSPVTMKEKLGDLFDEPKFMLVDCFTDGKGHGDPVFSRFYDHARGKDLAHVVRVADPADIDSFTAAINEIEGKAGVGAKYVFDSLTGMQDLWADTTRAYRFFTYACPRLLDPGEGGPLLPLPGQPQARHPGGDRPVPLRGELHAAGAEGGGPGAGGGGGGAAAV